MTNNFNVHKTWSKILKLILAHYGKDIFNSWIKDLKPIEYKSKTLTIESKNKFINDWVNSHYLNTIIDISKIINPEINFIKLTTASSKPNKNEIKTIDKEEKTEDLSIISCRVDPRFNFKNFVVGKPNELAYSAALAVAESENVIIPSNPLFLYGGVGLGKTHLMHSIKSYINNNNPDRKVIYISAEKFMYYFIKALRNKNIISFKERLRSIDILMIDDIQFMAGKEGTQEEFFHTLNELINNHKQVVISCDRSPSDLENIEDRIKSRLGWGLVADIHSTTYELRIGILQSKIAQMKIVVPEEVINFLANKITNNVRELEGALNKVIAHSTLIGHPINIESTHEILKDLLRHSERQISIDFIIKKVVLHYKIKLAEILSTSRSSNIVIPRQVAMYLAKEYTKHSFLDIARAFKKKDHTTVIHAVKKIKALYNKNSTVRNDINLLIRQIDH